MTCPACGEPNPGRARFCVACGSILADGGASSGEERKLVSIVSELASALEGVPAP
ncbi:MAG: zinc ribbon domain-containing protein [Actinomycetota bacterium]